MKKISGNKLLIKALRGEGVDTLSAYPDACTIDISDELCKQNSIKVILPRRETTLVHEADTCAHSTGKTGICPITSGPGATNPVTGLATACYDDVPLIRFTGQVARNLVGDDAFQGVDIVGVTRSIAKYDVTVRKKEDLGRIIEGTFYITASGRLDPVLVDLPGDVMGELEETDYPDKVNIRKYKPNTAVHIGQLKCAVKMLGKAKRPLFFAGDGVNVAHANEDFIKLASKTNIPIMTTTMGKGAIPSNHPLYVGNIGMHGAYVCNMVANECDLLFSIGTKFNSRIMGKLHSFTPNAKIVHIDIDTIAISKNIQVDIPIAAGARKAINKMLEYVHEYDTRKWLGKIDAWKSEHPFMMEKEPYLIPQDIIETINRVFEELIVVTDVGQHQMSTAQFIGLTNKKELLISRGPGAMGYGFPGAIDAKIGNPDTPVLPTSGDGGMQVNIQEITTAVLEELPAISCIFDNNNLGMVRQWQKLFYGKRYAMTYLHAGAACHNKCGEISCPTYTPDFVRLAEDYGAKGIWAVEKEQIEPALREVMSNKKTPVIIEFIINPEDLVYPMIQPNGTLEDMLVDC